MVDWSGEPAYRQVAEAIRKKIKDEGLEPGAKLPSLQGLMDEHGVSITVARLALKELKTEGLVAVAPGKGNFVADPAGSASQQFEQAMQQLGAIRQHTERMAEQMAALEGRVADLENQVGARAEPSASPGRQPARRGRR
jgi:DNA-binding GntR family transcriptional regulator